MFSRYEDSIAITPSGARIVSRFFVNVFRSSTLANRLFIEIKSANP